MRGWTAPLTSVKSSWLYPPLGAYRQPLLPERLTRLYLKGSQYAFRRQGRLSFFCLDLATHYSLEGMEIRNTRDEDAHV